MSYISKYISFHFSSYPISHFQSCLFQYLHCIQFTSIRSNQLTNQKNLEFVYQFHEWPTTIMWNAQLLFCNMNRIVCWTQLKLLVRIYWICLLHVHTSIQTYNVHKNMHTIHTHAVGHFILATANTPASSCFPSAC